MPTSVQMTTHKYTFLEQELTNFDLPITNCDIAKLEFWTLLLSIIVSLNYRIT